MSESPWMLPVDMAVSPHNRNHPLFVLPRVFEESVSDTGFWLVRVYRSSGHSRAVADHWRLAVSLKRAYDYRDRVYRDIWNVTHSHCCDVFGSMSSGWLGGTYNPLHTQIHTDTGGYGEGEITNIVIEAVSESDVV